MKRLRLSSGRYALVDAKLYPILRRFNWYEVIRERTSYAAHATSTGKKRGVTYMHQMVYKLLGRTRTTSIDHKDGNGLNNQGRNLRAASKKQQQFNKRGFRNSTSQYVGVNKDRHTGRWMARITINGRQKNLGRFKTEKEAAQVRDRYAKRHYGRFARLNLAA